MAYLGSANGVGSTSGADTTGADLIVAFVVYDGSITFSDSKGNTWTALTQRSVGSTNIRAYYCLSPTVGSGHTFTSSQGYSRVLVLWASGVLAYETENYGDDGTFTVNAVNAGNINPAGDDRLLIAGASWGNNTNTFAVDSGYTLVQSSTGVSNVSYGGGLAYEQQATDTTRNPQFTWSGDATRAVAINLAFTTSGGGGGGGLAMPPRRAFPMSILNH